MYTPEYFQESDEAFALEVVEKYGFATIASWSAAEPCISHLPLILDTAIPGAARLLGHMARANPHWKRFDGRESAVAIFHGPHGYISPSWYVNHPSVPTWNYVVVHVYGTPRVLDSDQTWQILRRLTEKHEKKRSAPWKLDLPPEYVPANLQAIVGFELPVTRIDAKFKLSQNKDAVDREGALSGLEREDRIDSQTLAAFARRYFRRKGE